MNKLISINNIAPVSTVGFALLVGAFLLSNQTYANDVVTTTTISVPVSCSMAGIGMNSHTSTIPNGTIQENIGITTIKAHCNDNNGFSIYAVGFSNDTTGDNHLHNAALTQSDDIITSTTFNGDSAWAMKIGVTSGTYTPTIAGSIDDSEKEIGDTDYSAWAVIPADFARVAYRNSGTDVNSSNNDAEGASITTTYKVYIDDTQSAGVYSGKVKYILLHPSSKQPGDYSETTASGKICYYPNAGSYEGTMGCQTIGTGDETTSTSAQLLAGNYSRVGYGFAGWSNVSNYSTDPNAKFYGPNEDIYFEEGTYTGTNPGLSLYAVWVESAGSFQDTDKVSELCGTGQDSLSPTVYTENAGDSSDWSLVAGLEAISALTDERDNQTYAIAKLSDRNCWMIENLRISDTHIENGNTVPTTLTVMNTNNPLTYNGTIDETVALKHDSSSTYYTNLSPSSTLDWCFGNACTNYSLLNADNTLSRSTNPSTGISEHIYGYGNYYNWYSAVAGQIRSSGPTDGDLCPFGWRLPYGGIGEQYGGSKSYGGFYYLADSMDGLEPSMINNQKFRSFPNNFLYSGAFGVYGLNSGRNGAYWSSSPYENSMAPEVSFILMLNNSQSVTYLGIDSALNRYGGAVVRCLARSTN